MKIINRSFQVGAGQVNSSPAFTCIPNLHLYHLSVLNNAGEMITHINWAGSERSEVRNLTHEVANSPKGIGHPSEFLIPPSTCVFAFINQYREVGSFYFGSELGYDQLGSVAQAPLAEESQKFTPVGYHMSMLNSSHVVYRTTDGHFHDIQWTGNEPVRYAGDLMVLANAPIAKGDPIALVTGNAKNIVVYRDQDDHISSIYWNEQTNEYGHDDLSGVAGSPLAISNPVGYYSPHNNTFQVTYVGNDQQIHEIYWVGDFRVEYWTLPLPSGFSIAAESLAAYSIPSGDYKVIVFASTDGRLHQFFWGGQLQAPLFDSTNLDIGVKCVGRPVAFTMDNVGDVIAFRGNDNNLYEVQWSVEIPYRTVMATAMQ